MPKHEKWTRMTRGEAAKSLNDGSISDPDLDRIIRESPAYQRYVDFGIALEAKGFPIRNRQMKLLVDVLGSGHVVEDIDPETGKVRRTYGDKKN